jgi:2-oxo-4-hydroxy-4-carboxy-5-ureidoimidazoline decarboxylase
MTITIFHNLDPSQKKALLYQCCGSSSWVQKMLDVQPVENLSDIIKYAEEKWYECNEADWKEAFLHHPQIGDIDALRQKFSSDQFAGNEQSSINKASEKSLQLLAEGNKQYVEKFGYIFIVCATGKSAEEMLSILAKRLQNAPHDEIKIAMEEQNKITKLRLEKLFD